MTAEEKSKLVKENAFDLGFDLFGIAASEQLYQNEAVLRKWVKDGMNAGMSYMGRNIEKRINPEMLLPGVKSVIVTGMNYYTRPEQQEGVPVISRYAYGKDYHDVITVRLRQLSSFIKALDHKSESMVFVDSGPILEKAWAIRAGLGWQGKHSIIINKEAGSFFFIGVLLTNMELKYDNPATDRCGTCTSCIDECPVKAINDDRTIDARKCIASINIESKKPVDNSSIESLGGRLVGCDRCQEVCPWNKNAVRHSHPEFDIADDLRSMNEEKWISLSEDDYNRIFEGSAIRRIKYNVLVENVRNITKYTRGAKIINDQQSL